MAGLSLGLATQASAVTAGPGTTFPVSWLDRDPGSVVGSNSAAGGMGFAPSPMASNGRYVVFASMSDNLAPGSDPNGVGVFRRDMQTGDIVLVSRMDGSSGTAIPGVVHNFSMSSNGNLVLMVTDHNLTPDDTDEEADAYLRNIAAGTTRLVTPDTSSGVYFADLSADGSHISFSTGSALVPGDVNGLDDVYRRRLADGNVEIVSRIPAAPNAGNNNSLQNAISGDGRWVAFQSNATNLVSGFVDNSGPFDSDVFVRDMTGGTTYLVSSRFDSATQGANGGSYEPDVPGSPAAPAEVKVAFSSNGTNLADNGATDAASDSSIYLRQLSAQPSLLVSRATGPAGVNADSRAHTPSVSDDGSRIVFSSDAGNLGAGADYYGVYLRDLGSDSTSLVSARNEYAIAGVVSGNGSQATWAEAGGGTPDSDPDLMSVFRRNLATKEIRLVSRPKGKAPVVAPGFVNYSLGDATRVLSSDGRYMVFSTYSSHLPNNGEPVEQVYRRDLANGKIVLVSRADGPNGAIATGASEPSVSADGNRVSFVSYGPLDPADTNDRSDVYVRDLAAGTTTLVSRADGPGGAVSNDGAEGPIISADGSMVVFSADTTNLGYPGPHEMVYVRDIAAGKTSVISRATGEAGGFANNNSNQGFPSADGSKVLFASAATNLSPDDPLVSRSYYVRDRNTNETQLVSRAPGLAGASLTGFLHEGVMSADGTKFAFVTDGAAAVPATAPWPVGQSQVVVRNLSDGTNFLGSSSQGGEVGDLASEAPSLSADGTVLTFETEAANIRTDISVAETDAVVVKDLVTGTTTGPPLFGDPASLLHGARFPKISDNGNCVLFAAEGHNGVSGDVGDLRSSYVYVRAGTCQDPKALVPRLTAVSLKPFKFRVAKKGTAKVAKKARKKAPRGTRIRFTLNTKARVTMRIDRKLRGRKVGKKCVKPTRKNRKRKACKRLRFGGKLVRANVAPGKRTVPFSGRIGKRALKPGRYRMVLRATGPGGSSAKVYRSFRVVR